ncbi:tetratricopeptide repeat protein, partial [Micromonospora chalcea]
MEVDQQIDVPLPPGLSHGANVQVLEIQMAALVAVDARYRSVEAPTDPQAITAYLLRREEAYWQDLRASAGPSAVATPIMMRRAVYLASLLGWSTRSEALTVLSRTELTSSVDAGNNLLDFHGLCYPCSNSSMVLEPLRPERLAEDLIAMATPGHQIGGVVADDWASVAPKKLLEAYDTGNAEPWVVPAMTVLVEVSHRWNHVADKVLRPLLESNPKLALCAGAVLSRVVDLPGIPLAILESIDEIAPFEPSIDFDAGLAALSTRLISSRLSAAIDLDTRATALDWHGRRLARAGLRAESIVIKSEALDLDRQLYASDAEFGPRLLTTISSLAEEMSELGRSSEALTLKAEALQIAKELSEQGVAIHPQLLLMVYQNLGIEQSKQG